MNDPILSQQLDRAEAISLIPPYEDGLCPDCKKEDCQCDLCDGCGMKFESVEDSELCDCGERERREISLLEPYKVEKEQKLTEGNDEK